MFILKIIFIIIYFLTGLKIWSDFYDRAKLGEYVPVVKNPSLSIILIAIFWPFFLFLYLYVNITHNFFRALILTIIGIVRESFLVVLNTICFPVMLIFTFFLFLKNR